MEKKRIAALLAAALITGILLVGLLVIGLDAWTNPNSAPPSDAPAASLSGLVWKSESQGMDRAPQAGMPGLGLGAPGAARPTSAKASAPGRLGGVASLEL